jgi:hypothetical protein
MFCVILYQKKRGFCFLCSYCTTPRVTKVLQTENFLKNILFFCKSAKRGQNFLPRLASETCFFIKKYKSPRFANNSISKAKAIKLR